MSDDSDAFVEWFAGARNQAPGPDVAVADPAPRVPAPNAAQGTSANGSAVPPNPADEFARTINDALLRGRGSAM